MKPEALRKVEQERDRLIAYYPESAEARAQWHFDLGDVWGRYASITGVVTVRPVTPTTPLLAGGDI